MILTSKHNREFHGGNAVRTMFRGLLVALVAMAITGFAAAQENTNLKFRGGIGVTPVTGVAATGAVNLNVVRGVNPAGPWRIADLNANVPRRAGSRSRDAVCFWQRAMASEPMRAQASSPRCS